MSCMDSVTDAVANVVGEIVAVGVRGIKASIKAAVKATSIAMRAVAFVGTVLGDAFRDMVEQKKVSAEMRQTEAFRKLEHLHNLQTLGFKNILKPKSDFVSTDEMTAEEVDRAISVLRDELTTYEAFRSFVFPDGLYEKIQQLTTIDVFDLNIAELKNVVEQIGSIRNSLSLITERGKAVICAVNDKVYEPSDADAEFTAEAVQSAYELLVRAYRDFEGAMGCSRRLPQESLDIGMTERLKAVVTDIEVQAVTDTVKHKERA